MPTNPWYLYLIRTALGTLYTGITTDPNRRLKEHTKGSGARSLRGKGPLSLEIALPAGDRSSASRFEARIKKLSHQQKEYFIKTVKNENHTNSLENSLAHAILSPK